MFREIHFLKIVKKINKNIFLFIFSCFFVFLFFNMIGKNFFLWGQVRPIYSNQIEIVDKESSLEKPPVALDLKSVDVFPSPVLEKKESLEHKIINDQVNEKNVFELTDFINDIYNKKLGSTPHLIRKIVVYPLIKISDIFLIDIDTVFTFFCSFLIIVFSWIGALSVCLIDKNKSNFYQYYFGIFLLFLALSLFMNGRLIYAFVGGACLLYGQMQWVINNNKKYFSFLGFLALILTNVSSGTFCVAFFAYFVFVMLHQKASKNFFGLLLFAPLTIVFFLKNGLYFNSVWELLSHGYGKIISNIYDLNAFLGWISLCGFLAVSVISFYYTAIFSKKYLQFSPFLIYGYSSIILGVFGWSTLSSVLCPLLILTPFLLRPFVFKNILKIIKS